MKKWNRKATDLPAFDGSMDPNDEYREFDMELIDVPVDQYLMVQERRNPNLVHKKHEGRMDAWEKYIEEDNPYYPEGISTPVLEYDVEGELTNWQEGYRRGVYAERQGEETLPVWMAKKRRRKLI